MSYEGYVQCICTNGHYFTTGTYSGEKCDCGSRAGWWNEVDQTNCDDVGIINIDDLKALCLITPATYQMCNLGFNHQMTEDIFRVPTMDETEHLRNRK